MTFMKSLSWPRALLPLAVCLAPAVGHAELGDNITIELEPTSGTLDDLDPIGIGTCVAALSHKMNITATIGEQLDADAETRKFLFVVRSADKTCSLATLETAQNQPYTEVDGCTYIGGTNGYDKSVKVELTDVPLRRLLPNEGADACTNDDQTTYRFLLLVEPNPADKRARGFVAPVGAKADDAGTTEADAGVDAGVVGSDPFTSTHPALLEIDLQPPTTPESGYELLAEDERVVVEFPSDQSDELEKYQVCWSSASAPSNCKTSEDNASLSVSTDDGITLGAAYAFTAAAIDDAGNLGNAVSIGQGAAQDFLDLAQYYRQMHGPETGGCSAVPGRGLGGLALAALPLLVAYARRRRSR